MNHRKFVIFALEKASLDLDFLWNEAAEIGSNRSTYTGEQNEVLKWRSDFR